MLPWTTDDLEALLRRAIEHGAEGPKLDLKRELRLATAEEKVDFAKVVSAVANTDADSDAHQGYGFLVLGAARGAVVGGIDALSPEKADNTNAAISQVLKDYLSPVPLAHVCRFEDPKAGHWGVVLIPPSNSQPHLFIRELSGRPARGDWFVRVNDITVQARPEDYARILTTATRQAMRPLESEVQELQTRVRLLEQAPTPTASSAGAAMVAQGGIAAGRAQRSAQAITGLLRTTNDEVEDRLVAEAQKIRSLLAAPDALPWSLNGTTLEQQVGVLTTLEELAQPFVEALAALVRYDRNEQYSATVARAVDLLAEVSAPAHGVGYQEPAQLVRLYPLVLALHAVSAVSANVGRIGAFKAVLGLRLRPHFDHDPDLQILEAYRYLGAAYPFFHAAVGEQNVVPISTRMEAVLPPWLQGAVVGNARDAHFVGEFLIGLASMGSTNSPPFPAGYMYDPAAKAPVHRVLRRHPAWLQDLLGRDPEEALAVFDEMAPQACGRMGIARGVFGGTAEAFRGGAK